MKLEGKVALITGSGSGIGQATAKLFAQNEAFVIVNDIHRENGEKTVEAIRSLGGYAQFIHADVTSPKSVENMINSIIAEHEQIDILFNNVGMSNVGRLDEVEPDVWDQVMNV